MNIVAVFDNNPDLVGKVIDGHEIYSMAEFDTIAREKCVTVAISTVPSQFSQEAVNVIVKAGITAILNFAPDRVDVPGNVHVQYIDLTTELQTLIFFDQTYQDKTAVANS